MGKLRVLSLFAGIGGFDLGLERTGGFETVAFCEINPFRRRVLAKHWPDAAAYADIRHFGSTGYFEEKYGKVDVIAAGFPCQDISGVGNRAGIDGPRSGLWREILYFIRTLRPLYVLLENVERLRAVGLGDILGELAAVGYDAVWHCVPAAYVGAGHPRDRIWIVAYPEGVRRPKINFDVKAPTPLAAGQLAGSGPKTGGQWQPEPNVGRVVHGLPDRVDRVAALGDAVVPQMAEMIGRAILEARAA